MADFIVLVFGGLLLLAIPALAQPALVGWKSRREAFGVLVVAASALGALWFVIAG
jgi:hypothetical protein